MRSTAHPAQITKINLETRSPNSAGKSMIGAAWTSAMLSNIFLMRSCLPVLRAFPRF
jgi:hypothetical protein